MLLLHQVVAGARERAGDPQEQPELRRFARQTLVRLEEAVRFRVDERATETILPLVHDRPERLLASASRMFIPAENAWIEIVLPSEGPIGLWIGDSGTLKSGSAIIYLPGPSSRHIGVPIDYDLTDLRHTVRYLGNRERAILAALQRATGRRVVPDLKRAGLVMLAVLALLCTPRLYRVEKVGYDRLNRKRAARGKWPLMAYHEVRIDLSERPVISDNHGRGLPRALHFVRTHLRLRLGHLELVRPHWRGDAQLGVKKPAYRITA